jgi:hypothetical protein
MVQSKAKHLIGKVETGSSKKRKEKGATQKTPQQAVMVMGPSGKLRMEWRPW